MRACLAAFAAGAASLQFAAALPRASGTLACVAFALALAAFAFVSRADAAGASMPRRAALVAAVVACAVRVFRADAPPEYARELEPQQ